MSALRARSSAGFLSRTPCADIREKSWQTKSVANHVPELKRAYSLWFFSELRVRESLIGDSRESKTIRY